MKLTRRDFIKNTALATAATATATTLVPVVHGATQDYKALVCVFLFGGNDAYNMLVPYPYHSVGDSASGQTTAYQQYRSVRPTIGLAADRILDTGMFTDNGVRIGIHDAMSSLQPLFRGGRAAAIINSGTLVKPTRRSDLGTASERLPKFLMAHNMQQAMWESGSLELEVLQGWGGRLLQMTGIGTGKVAPLYCLSGERKWLRHTNLNQIGLGTSGLSPYYFPNYGILGGIDGVYKWHGAQAYNNIYQDHFSQLMLDVYDDHSILNTALKNHPKAGGYSSGSLSGQLQVAGQLIRAQAELGQQRQVILVGLGGFDTHQDQQNLHPGLLRQVAEAMGAFNAELEANGLENSVTTFTMSDFGRRLPANNTGTDHGWGGHQIIMGGAVNGARAYGNWPDLSLNSEDDYGNGRMIPGIASDQVNATLAKWFGATDSQLSGLFESLKNFPGQETLDFIS
ncbi:DUF1501 domain-containing protein [Endozoicomonas lisbonensis]|uniref:Uncharacterized protein (DUF1501 family) n=1 Tax=Endozoicomonas lisbonensis TaxID=3120522 RepID=A0ABV2SB66_9GAMM